MKLLILHLRREKLKNPYSKGYEKDEWYSWLQLPLTKAFFENIEDKLENAQTDLNSLDISTPVESKYMMYRGIYDSLSDVIKLQEDLVNG